MLMMKVLSFVFKEFGSLLLLIMAIALSFVTFPIGLFWSLIVKPIYHLVKKEPSYSVKKVGLYFVNFLYQIWNVFKSLFFYIAYVIDLLGNVFAGELIEDIITPEEDTMLGNGDVTISVAVGDLQKKAESKPKLINGRGWFLIKAMNLFEERHALKAHDIWLYKQKKTNFTEN